MKKAFVHLHIAVFLAGFTGVLGRLITLNEALLVWYRLLITCAVLWAIYGFRKKDRSESRSQILKASGIGCVLILHWVSFYGSIKYSNVSVSVTCLSTIGFFTSFFEPLIMRRRIDWMEVLLGLLVVAGIYLIFNFYPQYKTGIIFGIISAMLASIFPIINKKLLIVFSPNTVTFYEMTGGFIALCFILPFYLYFFPAKYFVPSPTDVLWLVVLAGLCTVYAFNLSLQALRHISAFTVNLTYNFEPVYSIILAFIIFKENQFLGLGFYLGFALILLAISLQMVRVYQEKKNRTLADKTEM